jgi:hypothetical protein
MIYRLQVISYFYLDLAIYDRLLYYIRVFFLPPLLALPILPKHLS